MICTDCQYTSPRGAIFCLECGATLRSLQHNATRSIVATTRHEHTLLSAAKSPTATAPLAPLLQATVVSSGRRISLALTTPALIGRSDRSRDAQPEIDLGNDGGYDGGVSRRHARIFRDDGRIYVEDLDSSNGTFLNDRQLTPHTRYTLHQHATLRFGSIALRIDQI